MSVIYLWIVFTNIYDLVVHAKIHAETGSYHIYTMVSICTYSLSVVSEEPQISGPLLPAFHIDKFVSCPRSFC